MRALLAIPLWHLKHVNLERCIWIFHSLIRPAANRSTNNVSITMTCSQSRATTYYDTVLNTWIQISLVSSDSFVWLGTRYELKKYVPTSDQRIQYIYIKSTSTNLRIKTCNAQCEAYCQGHFVHLWAAKNSFILEIYLCRPNIGDVLVFYKHADLIDFATKPIAL